MADDEPPRGEQGGREMDSQDQTVLDQTGSRRAVAGYEPPRVERVLSPAELEREILYAGIRITGRV